MIIPCGRKKIWDLYPDLKEVQVKKAYTGIFHNLCKRYAEQYGDKWVVLSAKYGYLFSDDIVRGNYDLSFHHKSDSIISIQELRCQVEEKQLNHFSSITVLTGKKYKPYIEKSFADIPLLLTYPLKHAKGIGHMQKMLKESLESNKPI